jgi:prepilin-type N-terminal cleavage/methylation domain-containing protein
MPGSGPRARRRCSPGFTLIELIIVICIVALCAGLLLERLRFYQEAAEKAAMEYNVGVVKSALQLRVAALLVRGEERKIESLARANPIDWLMEPPPGYRGEFRAPQPAYTFPISTLTSSPLPMEASGFDFGCGLTSSRRSRIPSAS